MPPRKRKAPSEQGDGHSSPAIKKRKQIKLTQSKQKLKACKNRISKRRRAKLPIISNNVSSSQSALVYSDSELSAFKSAPIELPRAETPVLNLLQDNIDFQPSKLVSLDSAQSTFQTSSAEPDAVVISKLRESSDFGEASSLSLKCLTSATTVAPQQNKKLHVKDLKSAVDPQVDEACHSQTVLPYSLNSVAPHQDTQKEHDNDLKPTIDPPYPETCVSQTILANSLDSAAPQEVNHHFDDLKPEVASPDAETCPSQTVAANHLDAVVTQQDVTQCSGKPVPAVDVEDVATSTSEAESKPTSPDTDDKNDSVSTDTGPHFQYSRLYRLLGPNENPKENGIKAKLPYANVTVHKHVSDGSSYGSQYISTSAAWNSMVAFASNKKRFPKTIATIDVRELEKKSDVKFIDLTDSQKREEYLQDQRAKNLARKYEEVLVTGEIPASCILTIDSLSVPDSDSSDSDSYNPYSYDFQDSSNSDSDYY